MKIAVLLLAAVTSVLTGCATDLKAVRAFADETKKISVAFDPLLAGAVVQCQEREKFKRLYTGTATVRQFDPVDISKQAAETCKPIADENATAKRVSAALASYADKLSAVAGDGVASSVDDDYDALAGKLGEFKDFPKDKVSALSGLFKFLTRAVIARQQRREIEDALNHEEAIGLLADALVLYSERVYGGYIKDRTRDNEDYKEFIRNGDIAMPVILAKLQLIQLTAEQQKLADQRKVIPLLRDSVAQMKLTLKDLRMNLNNLSDSERLKEVAKLAKEVRALYQQLDKAF